MRKTQHWRKTGRVVTVIVGYPTRSIHMQAIAEYDATVDMKK